MTAVSTIVNHAIAQIRRSIEFSGSTVNASPSPCAATSRWPILNASPNVTVGLDRDENEGERQLVDAEPIRAEVVELHRRFQVPVRHIAPLITIIPSTAIMKTVVRL